jgi:four helix bundle protein
MEIKKKRPMKYNMKKKTSNTERRTPNIERRTSNAEREAPPLRINEVDSEYRVPKKTKYDLEDRLLEFAVAVVELTDDLPNTRAGNHIAGQLLRCGTSPYGHHGEVESAESRKDFVHKLKVCLKELRETRRWLRLISRLKKMNRDPRLIPCLTEAEELIRIFVASVRTAETQRMMSHQVQFDVRRSAFGVRRLLRVSLLSVGRWTLAIGQPQTVSGLGVGRCPLLPSTFGVRCLLP